MTQCKIIELNITVLQEDGVLLVALTHQEQAEAEPMLGLETVSRLCAGNKISSSAV